MQQAEKLLFNGQADEALALFSKEAENGNGRAMYFLGFILEHGLGHTAQDEDKAAAWFDKGQKAGDALATLASARWLGMDDRYHLLTDAFPKARAMAEDNDCFAKVELADMYLSGGIMINFEEGSHLLSQACAMGYWYALEKMGDLCHSCSSCSVFHLRLCGINLAGLPFSGEIQKKSRTGSPCGTAFFTQISAVPSGRVKVLASGAVSSTVNAAMR